MNDEDISSENTAYIANASAVYCYGDLLKAVQLSGIYNDSKTFVDKPMKVDPDEVLNAFYQLPTPYSKESLEIFLDEYFDPAGSDLVDWVPEDYVEYPAFLSTITDDDYYSWAVGLNNLWLLLGRSVNETVLQNPQRHSFLPRPFPMVVPGGRFRESYYWDSYWIIRGLLVCDMYSTALNVISNLIQDISNFGFVPNGGRIYYLDRSQPPLLSEMVMTYIDYQMTHRLYDQNLVSFIREAYKALTIEHDWWMNPLNGHVVDINGQILNRYHSNATTPRPESYKEDYDNNGFEPDFYQNVRGGAETGWDFSSRWIRGGVNVSFIATHEIVPVDLNSILYQMECNLAKLDILNSSLSSIPAFTELWFSVDFTSASYCGNATANNYYLAAKSRSEAIHSILWDKSSSRWRDFNTSSQEFSSVNTIESWTPLWAGLSFGNSSLNDEIVNALNTSGLIQPGGILTTSFESGQQWDAPNAWPPLVLIAIEGLRLVNTTNSRMLSVSLLLFYYCCLF